MIEEQPKVSESASKVPVAISTAEQKAKDAANENNNKITVAPKEEIVPVKKDK